MSIYEDIENDLKQNESDSSKDESDGSIEEDEQDSLMEEDANVLSFLMSDNKLEFDEHLQVDNVWNPFRSKAEAVIYSVMFCQKLQQSFETLKRWWIIFSVLNVEGNKDIFLSTTTAY
jgi:hypothetical protein